MADRYTFRLYDGDNEVDKFDHTTDAYDVDACRDLLVSLMTGKKIKAGNGRLDGYQNGRKASSVRA